MGSVHSFLHDTSDDDDAWIPKRTGQTKRKPISQLQKVFESQVENKSGDFIFALSDPCYRTGYRTMKRESAQCIDRVEILQNKLTLDPLWMTRGLRTIVTRKDKADVDPDIADKFAKFQATGIIRIETMVSMWNKDNDRSLSDNDEHLIAVLKECHIITEDENKKKFCIAPSEIKDDCPPEFLEPQEKRGCHVTSTLSFVAKDKYLPPVFDRLVAACVSKWPIAVFKKKQQIYRNCCRFNLDPSSNGHVMTLLLVEWSIQAYITKFGSFEERDYAIYQEAKEHLSSTLDKVFQGMTMASYVIMEENVSCPYCNCEADGCFSANKLQVSRDLHVRCETHDDMMQDRHELLRPWFPDTNTSESTEDGPTAMEEEEDRQSELKEMKEMLKFLVDNQQKQTERTDEIKQILTENCKTQNQILQRLETLQENEKHILSKVAEIQIRASGLKQEEINILRLHRAICVVCTGMMCEVMTKYTPKDDSSFYAKMNKLQRNIKCKFTGLNVNPQPANVIEVVKRYDITGLYTVIRNISYLKAKLEAKNSKGQLVSELVDETPRITSVEANVERIRIIRNKFDHSTDVMMQTPQFNQQWSNIEAIIDDLDHAGEVDGHKWRKELKLIKNVYKDVEAKAMKEEYAVLLKAMKDENKLQQQLVEEQQRLLTDVDKKQRGTSASSCGSSYNSGGCVVGVVSAC